MARGWESKSVESQIADGEQRRERRTALPAEEVEREKALETLQMSRRRVARELEAATSTIRRASLEHALRYLDDEIAKLS